MKYKYYSDSHTHSECSFDGNESIQQMCEHACDAGLYSLTITDHCECNEYFEKNVRDDIKRSVTETAEESRKYQDKLWLLTGIELGQPTQDPAAAGDALSLTDYDFVLGSLHNLRDEQDFYFLEYTEDSASKLLDRYLDELLELAQQNLFDSLAHLDYPLRYMIGNAGINISLKSYEEKLDAVLKTLVKNEKALEINTSGLRQTIGRTLPDAEVLRKFREAGGKYVTLGSDAHYCRDIGSGIGDGMQLLKDCGFSHFTIFEKRQPVMLPLI